jgi:ketosteroid isomerase-like protein
MSQDLSVARRFYTAFQAKDAAAMGACYADDARFSDPVFTDLDARGARAMWAMLLERGKDMSLTYEVLAESPSAAKVNWIAT